MEGSAREAFSEGRVETRMKLEGVMDSTATATTLRCYDATMPRRHPARGSWWRRPFAALLSKNTSTIKHSGEADSTFDMTESFGERRIIMFDFALTRHNDVHWCVCVFIRYTVPLDNILQCLKVNTHTVHNDKFWHAPYAVMHERWKSISQYNRHPPASPRKCTLHEKSVETRMFINHI